MRLLRDGSHAPAPTALPFFSLLSLNSVSSSHTHTHTHTHSHTHTQAEKVPIGGIIVNQVLADGAAPAFLKTRRSEQRRVLEGVAGRLPGLQVIEAPVVDLEVRGVPALRYFGTKAWGKAAEEEAGSV